MPATRGCDGADAYEQPLLESVDQVATNDDDRLALERALRAVPVEQREVVHLHAFEGWTFREIADALGLSINTVMSRYRYAIARMRAELT